MTTPRDAERMHRFPRPKIEEPNSSSWSRSSYLSPPPGIRPGGWAASRPKRVTPRLMSQ